MIIFSGFIKQNQRLIGYHLYLTHGYYWLRQGISQFLFFRSNFNSQYLLVQTEKYFKKT